MSQIMCLCLPRIYVLIGIAYMYFGMLTVVGWHSLFSALISGNLDEKSSATMDLTEVQLANY